MFVTRTDVRGAPRPPEPLAAGRTALHQRIAPQFLFFYLAVLWGLAVPAYAPSIAGSRPPMTATVCAVVIFGLTGTTAAKCTHLLAALKPPLRRLLWRRRDSATLPAHGRCRPVTPASLLFPVKRSETRKASKLEVWTVWTKSRTSSYPIISFMASRFFSVTMMNRQCPPERLAHVSPMRRFSLESSLLTRWSPLYSTTRIRPSTSLQTKSG